MMHFFSIFLLFLVGTKNLFARGDHPFELSASFSLSRSSYGGEAYSWSRRAGISLGYEFLGASLFQVHYQSVTSRINLWPIEDVLYEDTVLSLELVQTLAPSTWILQPFVKGGFGQLKRLASGGRIDGSSPNSVNSLSGILGVGARLYLSERMALRVEGSTYLTGGLLRSWADNLGFMSGVSVHF